MYAHAQTLPPLFAKDLVPRLVVAYVLINLIILMNGIVFECEYIYGASFPGFGPDLSHTHEKCSPLHGCELGYQ